MFKENTNEKVDISNSDNPDLSYLSTFDSDISKCLNNLEQIFKSNCSLTPENLKYENLESFINCCFDYKIKGKDFFSILESNNQPIFVICYFDFLLSLNSLKIDKSFFEYIYCKKFIDYLIKFPKNALGILNSLILKLWNFYTLDSDEAKLNILVYLITLPIDNLEYPNKLGIKYSSFKKLIPETQMKNFIDAELAANLIMKILCKYTNDKIDENELKLIMSYTNEFLRNIHNKKYPEKKKGLLPDKKDIILYESNKFDNKNKNQLNFQYNDTTISLDNNINEINFREVTKCCKHIIFKNSKKFKTTKKLGLKEADTSGFLSCINSESMILEEFEPSKKKHKFLMKEIGEPNYICHNVSNYTDYIFVSYKSNSFSIFGFNGKTFVPNLDFINYSAQLENPKKYCQLEFKGYLIKIRDHLCVIFYLPRSTINVQVYNLSTKETYLLTESDNYETNEISFYYDTVLNKHLMIRCNLGNVQIIDHNSTNLKNNEIYFFKNKEYDDYYSNPRIVMQNERRFLVVCTNIGVCLFNFDNSESLLVKKNYYTKPI